MKREEIIAQLKTAYPKCAKEVNHRLQGGFDDHSSLLGQAIDEAIKLIEKKPCKDVSPTAVPVTVKAAKRLLQTEWEKEVAKDKSNVRLLVAYKMAIDSLDGLRYVEKLIGWVRDNADSSDYMGDLSDTLRIPLWWFEQF